jgi:iron complex transport system ATP-binding protein
MAEEDKIISTENLSIGYPVKGGAGKIVKNDICLSTLKGELIALIGGNGVGKSTLLRTLAGFQPCISGKILIKGLALNHYKEKDLARIMSFVSTEIIRVSNLTVFDLVALGRYPHTNWSGRLTEEDRSKVEEAISMVGLNGYENRPVNFISDGERQKTMIARTLAQDTDIILLDEPTAFLDLSNKYEIVHILHRLAYEKGKTILFSTHDLSTAIAECDRIWLMLGDEVKEGSPEDLVLNGSFSSLFTNKNLYFDTEKGDYRIVKETGYKAMVKGEGTSYNWTVKALERIGYEIITDLNSGTESPVLKIEITQSGWLLNYNRSELIFDSLYDLCRYLKNSKIN